MVMVKYDYTGKEVYMGIDVHKKTYACVSICEGSIIKKDTMAAKPQVLITYIKNHFSNAIITTAYEAGFSGFYLHRQLINAGIKKIVCKNERNDVKGDLWIEHRKVSIEMLNECNIEIEYY